MPGTVLDSGDMAAALRLTLPNSGSSALTKRGVYFSHIKRLEVVLGVYSTRGTQVPSLFQLVAFIPQVTKEKLYRQLTWRNFS